MFLVNMLKVEATQKTSRAVWYGGASMTTSLPSLTLDDVRKHDSDKDAWLAIEGKVYDVTNWAKRHPGGRGIIMAAKGQDATDAFVAMHPDRTLVDKYLTSFEVGTLSPLQVERPIDKDFRALRAKLQKEGYFDGNPLFFFGHLTQVVVLEIVAAYLAFTYGLNSLPMFFLTALLLGTAQAQAGWLQHDFGHLSVLKSPAANRFWHRVTIAALKGASGRWWVGRHSRHHAKPNILGKDPDLKNEPYFIFGKTMAEEGLGWKYTPAQPYYWFFLGPPIVTTVVFVLTNFIYVLQNRYMQDLTWAMAYFFRFWVTYTLAGGWQRMIALYFTMRIIESSWFAWISAMSHFPMVIERDQDLDWVTLQLQSTQNVHGGYFNNWFAGHLNYQIEHHLFPTMPRHNYPKVAPQVKELCKKYNIAYNEKSMLGAFKDVVRALEEAVSVYVSLKKQKKDLRIYQHLRLW